MAAKLKLVRTSEPPRKFGKHGGALWRNVMAEYQIEDSAEHAHAQRTVSIVFETLELLDRAPVPDVQDPHLACSSQPAIHDGGKRGIVRPKTAIDIGALGCIELC